MPRSEGTQRGEPNEDDRAEHASDGVGALALKKEQQGENDDGDGHHVLLQRGIERGHALGGTQHGDCRGDHTVAVEQGGSDQDDDGRRAEPAFGDVAGGFAGQREQGEDAALAAVVGPHDVSEVFKVNREQQRPKHQREDAEHALGAVHVGQIMQTFPHRVERTGADIAEDDAQRTQAKGETDGAGRAGRRGRFAHDLRQDSPPSRGGGQAVFPTVTI
jgi:hypothetical protein